MAARRTVLYLKMKELSANIKFDNVCYYCFQEINYFQDPETIQTFLKEFHAGLRDAEYNMPIIPDTVCIFLNHFNFFSG